MKATKKQKQLIHINAHNRDLKEEYVQWATGDVSKTSTNDLSFEQANKILKQLGLQPHTPPRGEPEGDPLYWAYFQLGNKQHMQIQSLLHQIKWTLPNTKWGRVPDLKRFGSWLQSKKSPVNKPLKKMNASECNKIIHALNGILNNMYK